jgi:SAM-dependent methyltransferase
MPKELPREQLDKIEKITLDHYDNNALSFWQGTKCHDVTQNYQAFLSQFPAAQKLDILDFGCGPGRDLAYFKSLGHRPVGLDGSETFCNMARKNTGCHILYQQFLKLALPDQSYDGIFANASLFHVPGQELPRVLQELYAALRPGGILFSSNPRGSSEGWSGQRYGHFIEFETTKTYLEAAGFKVLNHYYRPAGVPCAEQPWLAVVSQKIE